MPSRNRKRIIIIASIICAICFMLTLLLYYGFKEQDYISVKLNDNTAVKLFNYKSITVNKNEIPALDDNDISSIISFDLSSNNRYIRITDRSTVEEDDIILIDIFDDTGKLVESDLYYKEGEIEFLNNFDSKLYCSKVGDELIGSILTEDGVVDLRIIVKGIYRYADINRDISYILSYYNCNNYDELCDYIRNKSYNDWAYDYMWRIIVEKSRVEEYSEQIESEIGELVGKTEDTFPDVESANNHYRTSITISKEELYEYYSLLLIGEAILQEEGIVVTDSDINEELMRVQDNENVSIFDLEERYGRDYFYYRVQTEKIKKVLIPLLVIEE